MQVFLSWVSEVQRFISGSLGSQCTWHSVPSVHVGMMGVSSVIRGGVFVLSVK